MFQKILSWIREVLSKMINPNNIKQNLRVEVAMNPLMANALQTWSLMYINQSPWVGGDVKSLNLAAAIAAELSRAVTLEMELTLSGSARADYLTEQMSPVLNNLRIFTEYGAAKGGIVFKPYPKDGRIVIDYVQADQFYPVAFDVNGNISAAVFADQKTVGNQYYTRLEYHALLPDGYHITNTCYKSPTRDVLGSQIPLTQIEQWMDIEPEAIIYNIERPLFAYFKMPIANNIDPSSPLGVSVYARAVALIEQADRLWSDFLWEFESGKRALYTDTMAFGKDADGKPLLPDKRLYRLLDLNSKIEQKGLFEDWTPTLREVNILNGLDAILKRIEFTCGLAQGTISDPSTVALTATEIKMGKQRTYATITDTQKSLEDALNDLLYAMDVWATLSNFAPRGTYTPVYWWDDSIVADHDTQFMQDQQALTMQVMSKTEFRMRNYGEDEVTARKMLDMLGQESSDGFFPAETDFVNAETGTV